ncbi:MAG: hypothetical protein JWQ09_5804 [Segetibacter sp.]|nr:hypothetical protein [Segetibacter sp.]
MTTPSLLPKPIKTGTIKVMTWEQYKNWKKSKNENNN